MPEGDTIFRTAASLHTWLAGRQITAARSVRRAVPAGRLVGQTVEAVEARAKHLLLRFTGGDVLHTHMRMTGSWHVYRAGQRWQKPGWQARLVLEAGDRVAVCFNAPVIELLTARDEQAHPVLTGLGPDVLRLPLDLDEVRRRAGRVDPDRAIGELLLDQRVVSGIGNIYRCEALFLERVNPWRPQSELGPARLDALVQRAATLMQANVAPAHPGPRQFGLGGRQPWVYGRTGRPCRRCRMLVASRPMGADARIVHWCPGCQGPAPG